LVLKYATLCIKRTNNLTDFCGDVNHHVAMQDRTINNALLALAKQGGSQAKLAEVLLMMRGVEWSGWYQIAPTGGDTPSGLCWTLWHRGRIPTGS
jgi:hypothetical protein